MCKNSVIILGLCVVSNSFNTGIVCGLEECDNTVFVGKA